MKNIPDFIIKPSEIKSYFGDNQNFVNYIKKISKGLVQTSQNFYNAVSKQQPDALVPPMVFIIVMDLMKPFDQSAKPHIVPTEIPNELLGRSEESEKGMALYIAGSLSEVYIAINMGATQREDSKGKESLKSTNKILGVVFHSEAAMVKVNKEDQDKYENEGLPPTKHPDRQDCYINTISTMAGEGVITYEMNTNADGIKVIDIDNPTCILEFSNDDEVHSMQESRFSSLLPKALEYIQDVDKDFSIDDIINSEGMSNFASKHSSVYKP